MIGGSPDGSKVGNFPPVTDLAVTESIGPRWAARRQLVFQVLGAFFVGNALLAELIGGKLFQVLTPWHAFTLSCGVVLWPFVFVMTDVVNEYFGRVGVRRLSFLAAGVISYAFAMLAHRARPGSPLFRRSTTAPSRACSCNRAGSSSARSRRS